MSELRMIFGIESLDSLEDNKLHLDEIIEEVKTKANEKYAQKEEEIGEEDLRELERVVMLKVVDQKWMDHIDAMDELKDGIGLRAYGQKDPVVQYRIEGFEMFDAMVSDIRTDVVKILLNIHKKDQVQRTEVARVTKESVEDIARMNIGDGSGVKEAKAPNNTPIVNEGPKVGRNDPCPCGSGKKYKNCCGRNQ